MFVLDCMAWRSCVIFLAVIHPLCNYLPWRLLGIRMGYGEARICLYYFSFLFSHSAMGQSAGKLGYNIELNQSHKWGIK